MRFDLDEQQRELQGAVADYLTGECTIARAVAPHETGSADFNIWRGLMELGIGGIVVPNQFGGLGLGLLELAVVAESIGRFAAPGPFLEHALATLAIAMCGSEDQKSRWLAALSSGEKRATVAFAESHGEWAVDAWSLDGVAKISGQKRFVLHAEGADLIVVGLKGGRLALLDSSAKGMTFDQIASTDAGKQLAHVSFSETPIDVMPIASAGRIVDAGLVLLSADAFGGASESVARAVEYAKEREQFGRKIGSFQALKHQLADMALAVEPTIGLYWYAAHVFDTQPKDAPLAAALAKAHITELYPKIARKMIEAHGGIGYTWEYGAHVWLKRALFDQAYFGMPYTHRARAAQLSGW